MSKKQPIQASVWRERRRMQAWELHQQGWSQHKIAANLGVSQSAVSYWLKRVREGGVSALRRYQAPGRKAYLTNEQLAQLPSLLARGVESFGFAGTKWTTRRVAIAIHQQFGVLYHPGHVSRLLRRHCPQWRHP